MLITIQLMELKMKTTRYRFEQAVQEVKEQNVEWLKEEFIAILESDKDYTRKADYIGLSIASIDEKAASLDEEIKELQQLKLKLKLSKELALRVGAEVFTQYGIEKLEGASISSLTLTPVKTKELKNLEVYNENELIKRGYYKLTLDEEEVIKELETLEGKYELLGIASLVTKEVQTIAKLKINKRRGVNNTISLENNLEELTA
jgi:hypothetical protein